MEPNELDEVSLKANIGTGSRRIMSYLITLSDGNAR